MDTQDKTSKIQKVSLYVFLGYFLFILVSVFIPVPDMLMTVVNILVITELYGSRIVTHYLTNHKVSVTLVLLFLVYLCWYGYQIYLGNTAWEGNRVITLLLAYAYVIVAEKMTTGRMSRRLVMFSVFFVGIEVVKLFAAGDTAHTLATLAQVAVILALVDPMMRGLAQKGAKKREEAGLETENVPLIRRILFGKTGKLRTDLFVKMEETQKAEPGSASGKQVPLTEVIKNIK